MGLLIVQKIHIRSWSLSILSRPLRLYFYFWKTIHRNLEHHKAEDRFFNEQKAPIQRATFYESYSDIQ
ncbi:hypothetical protein T4D_6865 [Trichinella pseudospiralis]|uniref:Uncharacterized protein n=1 Tax=Trichinella pseudospiralis TaxID=6337 RepID=A0A0V1FTX3_TRIPS|nr:hypothetical protein T4D_6865 [Trichinella pseudospiralis]